MQKYDFCQVRPPLSKGGAERSEAEGFLLVCGCGSIQGKARRNPSGRLRRPPPFDKGGSACQKTSTLLYRECRGDHWSPASLAQQRAFRDGFLTRHTGTGEQCSPLQEFFDSLHLPLTREAFCPHRLWINFLSSPCFTAALSTTQVRNTSMGSIVVFFTRPEVK